MLTNLIAASEEHDWGGFATVSDDRKIIGDFDQQSFPRRCDCCFCHWNGGESERLVNAWLSMGFKAKDEDVQN